MDCEFGIGSLSRAPQDADAFLDFCGESSGASRFAGQGGPNDRHRLDQPIAHHAYFVPFRCVFHVPSPVKGTHSMQGLATRNALHTVNDAAHGCAEDHDYAFRHGRASDRVMGYGAHDDFTLPRRAFMPDFMVMRNGLSLGTPGEAARARTVRLDALWSKAFAIGAALVLALAALWFVNAPPTKHVRLADTSVQYRAKAARLAVGKSRYELDREGCLIGLHKAAAGPITHTAVSTHC